jgi:hypothetical protein
MFSTICAAYLEGSADSLDVHVKIGKAIGILQNLMKSQRD